MKTRAHWIVLIASTGLMAGCGTDDGSDPTLPRITGGALVTIAATTTTTIPSSYTVQEGDTLTAIADRFHVDANELAAVNGITNPDDIQAGQTLNLPDPSATTTTTASP